MRACLLHCMPVRLRKGYTQAYMQIMQHTHTHKAVIGRVKAKKLLSRRRQSNYSLSMYAYASVGIKILFFFLLEKNGDDVKVVQHPFNLPQLSSSDVSEPQSGLPSHTRLGCKHE